MYLTKIMVISTGTYKDILIHIFYSTLPLGSLRILVVILAQEEVCANYSFLSILKPVILKFDES